MPSSFLRELYVEELGGIERAHLEFHPGFSVLTGETGAGKTLLVGALELCLGRDTATARRGVGEGTRVSAVLETVDGEVALAREFSSSGRLRALVNGAPTSADALRRVGEEHIDIHGQRDSLKLAQRSEVLRLLDHVGSVDVSPLAALRARHREIESQLEALTTDPEERQRLLDYWTFQIEEFEAISPRGPEELSDCMQELEELTTLSRHLEEVVAGADRLDGDDDGVLTHLADVSRRLGSISELASVAARLEEALALARDAVHDLRTWADPDRLDRARLGALEERVDVLQRLARKYGGHLADAFSEVASLRERRQALVESDDEWHRLHGELDALRQEVALECERLATDRRRVAEELEAKIRHHLAKVALDNADLRCVVEGEDGSQVRLEFRPHPRSPWGSLGDMASGGELSRVLLAVSLATDNSHTVALYDEVDAGLGGVVANHIGESLLELSSRQQVLAVTHLASVAARAAQHFVVERSDEGRATVREITGDDRIREVARMINGSADDPVTLVLARQLLFGFISEPASPAG